MITGTGVHDRPESLFTINWIECSRSNGTGVDDPPERAVMLILCSKDAANHPRPEAPGLPAAPLSGPIPQPSRAPAGLGRTRHRCRRASSTFPGDAYPATAAIIWTNREGDKIFPLEGFGRVWLCCMDVITKVHGRNSLNPICYLSDTDITQASEPQHSVQVSGGEGNLGRLGLVCA
jgi:hypothetical protein